jgi:hypothetical protein
MWGPEKIWLRLEDEQGREVGKPQVLTFEECARRTNQSVRELKRQIWMERRDKIAAIRAEYASQDSSLVEKLGLDDPSGP